MGLKLSLAKCAELSGTGPKFWRSRCKSGLIDHHVDPVTKRITIDSDILGKYWSDCLVSASAPSKEQKSSKLVDIIKGRATTK